MFEPFQGATLKGLKEKKAPSGMIRVMKANISMSELFLLEV